MQQVTRMRKCKLHYTTFFFIVNYCYSPIVSATHGRSICDFERDGVFLLWLWVLFMMLCWRIVGYQAGLGDLRFVVFLGIWGVLFVLPISDLWVLGWVVVPPVSLLSVHGGRTLSVVCPLVCIFLWCGLQSLLVARSSVFLGRWRSVRRFFVAMFCGRNTLDRNHP